MPIVNLIWREVNLGGITEKICFQKNLAL